MDDKFKPTLDFYQASGEFLGALHQPLGEKFQTLFEKVGIGEGPDGWFAQVAAAVYPNEASTADLLARSPYGNPEGLKADLKAVAERGWITLSETGFTATQKSLDFAEELIGLLFAHTEELENVLSADLPGLVSALGEIVAGAEEAPFDTKPTFTFGRNYEHEDTTPSLAWVRRHLMSLGSYRDDCHLAAWSEIDVPGYAWETLTFIWQGHANTAAELVEKLPYRNYGESDYAGALEKLVKLGWIEEGGEGYQLTEQGRTLREDVETKTDENYQAAFAVLPEGKLAEVTNALKALTTAITPEEEGAAPA